MKKITWSSLALVLVPAVVSFFVAPMIWKMAPGPEPTSVQIPFFIALSVIESLAFGVGIWFLVEGKKLLRRTTHVSQRLTVAAYVATAWSLLSWWVHDNLHKANGENFQGLLYIEYGFHVTLILAACIIACYFLATLRERKE